MTDFFVGTVLAIAGMVMLYEWYGLVVTGDLTSYDYEGTRFGFSTYADPLTFARIRLIEGLWFLLLAASAGVSGYRGKGWVHGNFWLYILAVAVPIVLEVAFLSGQR